MPFALLLSRVHQVHSFVTEQNPFHDMRPYLLTNIGEPALNKAIAYNKQGRTYPAVLVGRLGVNKDFQGAKFRIGAQIMDFIKKWFLSTDNKTGCRFILVDAVNNSHTIAYYERNGFKPLFSRENDEKAFYDICETEELRTRMYYFDLLTY